MSFDWSQLKTFRAGTTNLVAAMCEELDLEGIINRLVEWDERQCLLSPGTLAKAVLIHIMDDRHALWRVEEYLLTVTPKPYWARALGRNCSTTTP